MRFGAERARAAIVAALTAILATVLAATAPGCGARAVTPASATTSSDAGAHAQGEAILGAQSIAGPTPPIAETTMLGDLRAIGLDPASLPPLDQLPPEKLRKVMRTFDRALGVTCADCHVENDYAAPTPRKSVAAKMWDRFVRGLTTKSGGPIYCDTCHRGHVAPLLDRHDQKALSRWMDDNYVAALARADGKEHGCETCHGDPFEPRFLEAWARARVPGRR